MIKYKNGKRFHLRFYDRFIDIISLFDYTVHPGVNDVSTGIQIEPDDLTCLLIQGYIRDTIQMCMIVEKQEIVLTCISRGATYRYFYPEERVARIVPVALAYPKIEFEHM